MNINWKYKKVKKLLKEKRMTDLIMEDNKGTGNLEEMILDVLEDGVDERIDSFISEKTILTRTRVQTLIKDGKITVNGKMIKPSYRVEENDIINIVIPQVEGTEIVPENINIDIVYEDEDIAIINKQAGLVVHPAQGHHKGTLVNGILYHMSNLSGINGELRPGIVHRLDKDTSGLLIIAKNDRAHVALTKMFQDKEIKKTYLAVVKGNLNKSEGRIITKIARNKEDRKKMTAVSDSERGKIAITNYKVIFQKENLTLVKVNIETGRTHQIRVHMKHIGYPILGDMVYGKKDSEKRQMLHAHKLEFHHPVTGKHIKITGELPEDFKRVLKRMGFSSEDLEAGEIQDERK